VPPGTRASCVWTSARYAGDMAMRPPMKFSTASLQFTLIALDNTKIDLRKAGEAAVNAAGAVLYKHALKAVGLRDHSLTELAQLGHPYARRHGAIRIHTDAPWQVHRAPTGGLTGAALASKSKKVATHKQQTDKLFKATYGSPFTAPGGSPAYRVWFDTGKAPEAVDVTQGTKRMLPRDPLWITANLPDVRKEMMVAIVRKLGRDLRSKVGVRFGAGVPGGGGTSVT